MALKTFVKISNVSSLSDARYCAGMMVDVIGFNVDPSSDSHIALADYTEITEWVAGVDFVGEFEKANLEQIKHTIKNYPLSYIQISQIDLVEKVNLLGYPIIFKLNVNTESELSELKSTLSYLDELVKIVIIKSENEAIFDELDSRIGYYHCNFRLVKGFGITSMEHLHKFPGLEMEATIEDKPGNKDYGMVMDVLEAIEAD
jgi:phosphoribosylanthranilate isomerase